MPGSGLRIALAAGILCAPLLLGSAPAAATVYEDGESGAGRWTATVLKSSGAGVSAVADSEAGSSVISLRGTLHDVFLIGGYTAAWDNREERVLSWRMRTENPVLAYAIVRTERGLRRLRYSGSEEDMLAYKPGYIDHGLGEASLDGSWRTHVRDLQADLEAAEPGNRIVAVNGLVFRGAARLDDIALHADVRTATAGVPEQAVAPPAPSPAVPVEAPTAAVSTSPTPPIQRRSGSPAAPLAFPGAEGHGRFAKGGRGGRIVVVDTLSDTVAAGDGRTSLREALEVMSGPRTIVFDVGGIFDTGRRVILMDGEEDSRVTLACQSAPAPGVLIRGNGIRIRGGARDIVMRHCAIRNIDPGAPAADASRALAVVGTRGATGDMIFDHMSLGWATDETFTVFLGESASDDLRDVTLSRSIVAEGDADSSHSESGRNPARYIHAMGPSCTSLSRRHRVLGCSIIGNLIANNARRNPLMWGVSGEVVNNIVYNWHEIGLDARPHFPRRLDLHVRGNEFRAGPTSRRDKPSMRLVDEGVPATNLRVADNRFVDGASGAGRQLESVSVGSPDRGASAVSPARIECVGASRPVRSGFDARIVEEYRSGTGRVGIGASGQRDYTGHPSSRHPSSRDTDRDGMADAWETRMGLDPNDPGDHRGDVDGDGYTNVEEFLSELGAC